MRLLSGTPSPLATRFAAPVVSATRCAAPVCVRDDLPEALRAELTDDARATLVKAAQSARFNRRMRGAASAYQYGNPEELAVGTLKRQEAEAGMLLWGEVIKACAH